MPNAMSDDEIVARLQAGVRQASGFTESKLAKERERSILAFEGSLPGKTPGSNSGYVSTDVWDAVNDMQAQLLDVFGGTGHPVKFPATNAQDVEAAHIATEYVNHVLFSENNGFRVLQDTIQDALLGRNGIAKVWWEEKVEDAAFEMSDADISDLQAYITKHPDAEVKSIDLHEDGVTIKRAEITVKEDKSKVRVEVLPPEEFGISALSRSIKEAALVFHRQMLSASDLIKQGYDPKLVATLQDEDRAWLSTEPELLLRFDRTDDIASMRDDALGVKARRLILVYECYAELDLEDTGKAELYKIIFAGNTVLHKERVSRKPFVAFTPLPRSHAFWGSNFSRQVIPTQVAKTYLTRAVIDHATITVNPRYMVVRNSVTNPRELLENRIGGIVNVLRPDGVQPLPQAGLNPFVYQTIDLLTQNKERITGISALSTGLDPNALSKQNSADMVSQMVSLSQIRQRIVARQFAEGFLTDLYLEMYQLIVENESREKIIRVAGSWQPINPSTWPERPHLEVEFKLGYGEQEQEAAKWVQIDQYLSQPGLAPFYPQDKRFNVISQALRHKGIKDIQTYVLTPAQIQPPPPDPMQQAQLETQKADAAVKNASAQALTQKSQLEAQQSQLQHQIEIAKLQLEQAKLAQQLSIERDKLAHQVTVDSVEMQLQKEAQAQAKLTAVAEPK